MGGSGEGDGAGLFHTWFVILRCAQKDGVVD
jgi:hypothetical protein